MRHLPLAVPLPSDVDAAQVLWAAFHDIKAAGGPSLPELLMHAFDSGEDAAAFASAFRLAIGAAIRS